MGLRFTVLGSSSAGNSYLIESLESKVLVDAGFSGKRICEMLEEVHLRVEDIEAVFLTHEHGDHATGVKGLSKYGHLKFFANHGTAQAVNRGLKRSVAWQIFETGTRFKHKDISVDAFAIPHDAYDPVGFVFKSEGGSDLFNPYQSIGFATDLGYIPQLVAQHVKKTELLVLEANHDLELLENCEKRPFSVKQRIRGRHGHLSNCAAREYLMNEAEDAGWRDIFLTHLSRDCNSVSAVEDAMELVKKTFHKLAFHIIDPDVMVPVALRT